VGNVPILRFKEFEGAWEEVQLGEIVSFRKGKGIAKKDISDIGEPCILYGELYTKYNEVIDKIQSRTDVSINNPIIGMVNDVLIPASGETALDIATASSLTVDDVLIGGDINLLTPKEEVNGLFISYQINNKQKNELAKFAEGASVVHLYKDGIRKLRIYLPIHKEQVKISEFFKLMSEKIKRQEEKIELLKEQKKGYMQKIFNRELRFKDEYGNEFAEWKTNKLSDIAMKIMEKNKNKEITNVISNSAVRGLISQIDYFDKSIANNANISNYYVITEDDFVYNPRISSAAPYGPVSMYELDDKGIVSPLYLCFRINNETVLSEFMKYYFQTHLWHKHIYVNGDQGARHDRVSIKDKEFFALEVQVPTTDEQKKIIRFLECISEKIDKETKYYQQLKQKKKALMQQMFI